ncbi:MAG: hypothetical protein ACRD0K_30630 [Egibacteraceae bacterium]
MTGERRHEAALVDFRRLAGRLRGAAGLLGVVAVAGVIVDGLRSGLTFAVMVRWMGVFVLGMLVVTAVLVALHALRGADAAARRGESLSRPDVGLVPPRRRSRE